MPKLHNLRAIICLKFLILCVALHWSLPMALAHQQQQQAAAGNYYGPPYNPSYGKRVPYSEADDMNEQQPYASSGRAPARNSYRPLQQNSVQSSPSNRFAPPRQPQVAVSGTRRDKPLNSMPENMSVADINLHKCHIWIPMEYFKKYPAAESIQVDTSKQMQQIKVCCPGYAPLRWRGVTHCRPVCDKCSNGLCVAPGECRCYDEFVRSDNGDCVFTCPIGCLNGQCYLDGTCKCDAGYKLDESRKFCRPICSSGCGTNPYHNCTAPEVCGCAEGYLLTDKGCHPTCQPECGIGGECVGFNECECYRSYTLKDKVCQADCYQKCDNGICYGPNRCICKPGFTYHERSTHCVPQ